MELRVVRRALDLGATRIGGPLSAVERSLVVLAEHLPPTPARERTDLRKRIRDGQDPLGDTLLAARDSKSRRSAGVFYTPAQIVAPMVDWVVAGAPTRIVDAGCGSGRFSSACLRRRSDLEIVAVDLDPVATLICRAVLKTIGARRARVAHTDYTTLELPDVEGRTGFIGNPPYVRHHQLSAQSKQWAKQAARTLGHKASALAGSHAHFFLATACLGRPGDVGCFVTSSEWLDVNYGSIVRDLLTNGLGGRSLHVLDPRSAAFEDAMTTAAITCFELGASPEAMDLRSIRELGDLGDLRGGRSVKAAELSAAPKWSALLSDAPRHEGPTLRDVARVHRGTATGANNFFVMSRERAGELGVERWCRPCITGAAQVLESGGIVRDHPGLSVVLSAPADARAGDPALDALLRAGEAQGIDQRYLARHRKPWWRLGIKSPPPIVATYMARQPPAFALNPDGLVLLNIAHGIYPTGDMSADQLEALVSALNDRRDQYRGSGRTYHGGLEKFEPKEMEKLPIPTLLAGTGSPSV